MTQAEIVTVGVSEAANDKLDEIKELGYFAEKMDAYRFAVSLALAQGIDPPEIANRKPFLNVGSLDPDQTIRRAVEALMPTQLHDTTVYRMVERLADWGVNELHAQATAGDIDFQAILDQVAAKAG